MTFAHRARNLRASAASAASSCYLQWHFPHVSAEAYP